MLMCILLCSPGRIENVFSSIHVRILKLRVNLTHLRRVQVKLQIELEKNLTHAANKTQVRHRLPCTTSVLRLMERLGTRSRHGIIQCRVMCFGPRLASLY